MSTVFNYTLRQDNSWSLLCKYRLTPSRGSLHVRGFVSMILKELISYDLFYYSRCDLFYYSRCTGDCVGTCDVNNFQQSICFLYSNWCPALLYPRTGNGPA